MAVQNRQVGNLPLIDTFQNATESSFQNTDLLIFQMSARARTHTLSLSLSLPRPPSLRLSLSLSPRSLYPTHISPTAQPLPKLLLYRSKASQCSYDTKAQLHTASEALLMLASPSSPSTSPTFCCASVPFRKTSPDSPAARPLPRQFPSPGTLSPPFVYLFIL